MVDKTRTELENAREKVVDAPNDAKWKFEMQVITREDGTKADPGETTIEEFSKSEVLNMIDAFLFDKVKKPITEAKPGDKVKIFDEDFFAEDGVYIVTEVSKREKLKDNSFINCIGCVRMDNGSMQFFDEYSWVEIVGEES